MRLLGLAALITGLLFSTASWAGEPGVPWYLSVATADGGGIYLPAKNKKLCQVALRKMLRRPLTPHEQREQGSDRAVRERFATTHGCTISDSRPGPAGVDTSGKDKICHMPPCCQWSREVYKNYKGSRVTRVECVQSYIDPAY